MDYLIVQPDETCDDCGQRLWNISHFKACPKCKKLSCCDNTSHHVAGACYEQWRLAKTDTRGPFFR